MKYLKILFGTLFYPESCDNYFTIGRIPFGFWLLGTAILGALLSKLF